MRERTFLGGRVFDVVVVGGVVSEVGGGERVLVGFEGHLEVGLSGCWTAMDASGEV